MSTIAFGRHEVIEKTLTSAVYIQFSYVLTPTRPINDNIKIIERLIKIPYNCKASLKVDISHVDTPRSITIHYNKSIESGQCNIVNFIIIVDVCGCIIK